MSQVEEECRESIAFAYAVWFLATYPGKVVNLLAYERAIGLEPPF